METSVSDKQVSNDIQLKAEVEHVNFHSEDTGWSVLKIRDVTAGKTLIAVGYLPEVCAGQYYVIFGRWSHHKTFGPQFKFTRAVSSRPHTREGISRYLSSGLFKGVGKVTADRIVKKFGLETFDILDDDPEQLKQIPKVNKTVAGKIIDEWHTHKQSHETQMFLHNHGITGATARKLIKKYGSSLITKLSKDPYFLISEVRGIGFQKADLIGLSVGMDLHHPGRVQAGILYLLSQGEDQGHCYQSTRQLLNKFQTQMKLPDFTSSDLLSHMKPLTDSLKLISVDSVPDLKPDNPTGTDSRNSAPSEADQWHFRANLFSSEKNIAQKLANILSSPSESDTEKSPEFTQRVERWIEQFCEKSNAPLSELQKKAVLRSASSKVFILTGGPGVGKTTTANAMIALFRAMGKSIALAAPTGRAAQRLSEVSGREAKTIHRLLEWSAQDNCFKKDEENPLTSQVIMIDEASMLDVKLADSLISAIPAHSQLVLMGDVDQLPSVGPGNVLRDLIRSEKIPCLKLDEVFRQAAHSHIISAAHQINKGHIPEFSDEQTSDCRFISAAESSQVTEILKDLLTTHLPNAGYDPLRDVQILTPMNKGDLGSQNLNQKIQEWINPLAKSQRSGQTPSGPGQFILNDKVIQGVNNYELSVFNGDIGFVAAKQVEGTYLKVQAGDREISYDQEQARELSLAYAITIHKSQGSEFPVVIIPVSMSHYVMLQRNLIYTALTRARKLAIFIGEPKALGTGVRNVLSINRQTWLGHELDLRSDFPTHS